MVKKVSKKMKKVSKKSSKKVKKSKIKFKKIKNDGKKLVEKRLDVNKFPTLKLKLEYDIAMDFAVKAYKNFDKMIKFYQNKLLQVSAVCVQMT